MRNFLAYLIVGLVSLNLMKRKLYFENINILRGFAALSVLVYHVIEHSSWKSFPTEGPLVWFRIGWLGVDLFFVISGFVITLSALHLYETFGDHFYKIYLRRRLARIVPLYILTGFVFVLCVPTLLVYTGFYKSLIYHLLFIHNFDSDTFSNINGPNWTIAVEMQFYLLIMITIRYLIKLHPFVVLLSCVLISWAWRSLIFLTLCQGTVCNPEILFIPSVQVIGCLDEFGFGIFLCLMILDKNVGFSSKASIYQSPWFWGTVALGCAWLTFKIFWVWATYWEFWWMVIFWKTLVGMVFFALLALAIQVTSLIEFNRPIFFPFWYLGKISYGIYLWHVVVIVTLKKASISSALEFLVFTLVFTISLAALSWYFVEKPFIERFHE